MPLGILPVDRSGVNSIRILGVTPAGVSSNHIVTSLIPDIVNCSSVGTSVDLPDGTCLRLFLDVIGYIGDYQAMVHILDVTGVGGVAPCNFCTFKRAGTATSDNSDPIMHEKSTFAYSGSIHSGNLSFRRSKKRMAEWRLTACREELRRVGFERPI